MKTAATVAAALIAVVALFQIALALGAPMGSAAWGGQNPGRLPTGLRVASGIVGILVYPILVVLVLEAGGVIDLDRVPDLGSTGMWVVTGLFTLGVMANLVSRSKPERIWAPVSLVIAICCGIVASGL